MSQTVSEETTNHNNVQDDISSLTSASSNSNKGPSTKLVWFLYKGKKYYVRIKSDLLILHALKEACAMFGITAYGHYNFVLRHGEIVALNTPLAIIETSKTGLLGLKQTFKPKDEDEVALEEFFGQLSSTYTTVCSWFSSLSTTFKPASEKVVQTSTTGPPSSSSLTSLESNSSKAPSSDMCIPTSQNQAQHRNDNLRKRK